MPRMLTCGACERTFEHSRPGPSPAWCDPCRWMRDGDDFMRPGYNKTATCTVCGGGMFRGRGMTEEPICRPCRWVRRNRAARL